MKKISISLFILFIHMTTFSYIIENSETSDYPTKVVLTKVGKQPNWFTIKASYLLEPGKSGAWNQDDIRKN